jgi:HAD superfamily hydrolase (TIGR01549 family)
VPAYEAVVFDMDGVLLTMTDGAVIDRAAREAFAAFGVDPTDEAVEPFVRGDAAALAAACEPFDLDPGGVWPAREWAAAWLQAREMDAGRKRPYDDAADALAALDARIGLVSNNQHHTVGYALDRFGLEDLFETAYGRGHTVDALRRRKPDPHYVDRALADLGTRDALYVGDSGVDVEAAIRADVDSAFVRREHRTDYRLREEPDYEVSDLAELVDLLGD